MIPSGIRRTVSHLRASPSVGFRDPKTIGIFSLSLGGELFFEEDLTLLVEELDEPGPVISGAHTRANGPKWTKAACL